MNKVKKLPKFKNEDEAREFWAKHDLVEYFDLNEAIINPVLPNLKPSTRTITMRVPESLLNSIKSLANKKDVPYQSLMKILLDEKIKEEMLNQSH